MRKIAEGQPPPLPGCVRVEFTSPGGLVVRAFSDGGALMRICPGHSEAEDGLASEARSGAEPVPWASAAAREKAIAELRHKAKGAEGHHRAAIVQLLEYIRRTAYYEDT